MSIWIYIPQIQIFFKYIFVVQEGLQLNWQIPKQVKGTISVKNPHWTHYLSS